MQTVTQTEIINSLVSFGYPESHAIDLFKKYSDKNKLEYLIEYIEAKRSDKTISDIDAIQNVLSDR